MTQYSNKGVSCQKAYLFATWLSLWESCQRKLTERAFLTLSAPAGHLSQGERQDIVQFTERYRFCCLISIFCEA